MTDVSPNAAAYLISVLVFLTVFTLAAWRKREFPAGSVTGFLACGQVALIGLDMVMGRGLDRYEWLVVAAPGFLAAACLFGAEMLGLPDWLAVRLGVGLSDPRARFYERLRIAWRQSKAEMDLARAQSHGRYEHVRKAANLIDSISEFVAPSPEWSELRDDVVRSERQWIELARKNRNPERWPSRPHAYPILTARFGELGHAIVAERGLTMEEYASRNRMAQRLVLVTAVVVAICGFAVSRSSDANPDPRLWLELCGLYLCLLPTFVLVSSAVTRMSRYRG